MTGIVAWADTERDLRTCSGAVDAMTASLRHRGPEVTVWSSRSAVLACRHVAGGPGPMVHEDPVGTVALALAGHVTNRGEIARALGTPPPEQTGAPVLMRAYLRWGTAFVENLRGSFAIVVCDQRHRTVLLARDRLGVRPLYYSSTPGLLLAASEPRAIMANERFKPVLDVEAITAVLQPRLALPGETPLRDLSEVPPAHVVEVGPAGVTATRYWSLRSAPHRDSEPDTVARVRDLLVDAVDREVDGADPCAALLSGGLDSTSATALAISARTRRSAGPLHSFCIEFPDDPNQGLSTELRPEVDGPYAAAAAMELGSRHHPVSLDLAALLDGIEGARRARDLPAWGQFDGSMYRLFGAVAEHAPVAVTGEAADEVFGGYPYLLDPEVLGRDDFPWIGEGPRLSDHLSDEIRSRIDPREDESRRYKSIDAAVPLLPGEPLPESAVRRALFHGLCGPLTVILARMERMSAAHGVEVRFPFCDHHLVEYVWNVPWAMKSRGGVKGLLKAATGNMVPATTLARRKSAYPHAQHDAYERSLLARTRQLLEDPDSAVSWLFDPKRTTQLVDDLEAGVDARLAGGISGPQLLVQVIELDAWIRRYGVSLA